METNASCPSCKALIRMDGEPTGGPDTPGDAWLCFAKRCPATVCVYCYIRHNEAAHPALYQSRA